MKRKFQQESGDLLMDCNRIQEVIQTPDWQRSDRCEQIERHILACPECSRVWEFERSLSEIAVPETLPQPSFGFEASLMAELGIDPQPIYRPEIMASPISRWGWMSSFLLLAGLMISSWNMLVELFEGVSALAYAKFAELFAGKLVTAGGSVIGTIPGSTGGFSEIALMNVIFIVIVTASGAYAIKKVRD